jgi:DegV family protein with EDD domain
MGRIRFVTDSTAYFTKEDAARLDIKVVPLSVTFSGETRDEGFPGEFEDFYKRLETSLDFPTTSQPSIEAFSKVYEEILAEGDEIITLVISAKLSGTYNSASVAAEYTAPDKISVIDSETSVSNLKLLVQRGIDLANAGYSRAEIVKKLEEEKKKATISLTVDTLEYLKKGGRLSGAQALIGTLLNVKPIIGLIDGSLKPIDKVRGKNKALEFMYGRIPEHVEHITVCHIMNEEEAEQIREELQRKFMSAKVTVDVIGPVIGSHLGPKAVGICSKWI